MALVLERYLQTGGFTDNEAQIIIDVSRRLYALHKQAARTKRIIEFFHVSKSGGTTFCQLGRLNGCKTESFNITSNCLISYFRFNFYSNELVMHDHNRSWIGVHPCREFLNVVIFREPEARVISHMQNILKEYVKYYTTYNGSFWSAFDPASPDQWRALAVPVFDNYVVRSLLGGQMYNMPYGSVNETHLLAAKVITMQFEVLLSLSPQARELTQDIFGLGLGWQFDLRHVHVRATQQRAVHVFTPAVMEAVRAGRQLDQRLYEFALVLQMLDAITFGVARELAGIGVAGVAGVEGTWQRVPVEGLGTAVIAGGRWFNGIFYANATVAEEAAITAAKAAAWAAAAAAAEAQAADGVATTG
ncbi:hypothetical protein GPECTOR_46g202 [Gonium pectorale]|uniref:Sulfotransferase n=1 Tax=Gonium pectorale TaxID=33097 RepID=A0A150G8P4_GONPE|nr:hypothetical protein GPECTOR_46g202 [Gonium pectorale]|eukprot:KXZ46133.1 hypothetical protein GPECTOR_46g202 [Gonium pectorale]